MANPFSVTPANPLAALMMGLEGYDRSRKYSRESTMDAARQEAQKALISGGDTRSALARLIGAGDIQGANALANFGNQASDQAYKTGMLDVARQKASRQETPAQLKILEAAGINPASPAGHNALFPRKDTPMSATDKKAINVAEDELPRLNATIRNIERAKELNPKVFTGYTASLRGSLGTSGIPGSNMLIDRGAAEATAEWDQLMGQEAIKNMSETLKGASTDFEMKKFISIAADTSKPPEVRKQAMDRFLALAKDELTLRERRIKELRSGDYYKPGGQPTQAAPTAQFQNGQRAYNAQTRQTVEYQNGQWVPVQ
jgi:hypothetical protein